MHGSDDVLDFLFAQVLELHLQLAANLAVDIARDADAAGLGERLEPRRQIDAVAIEIAALDDHIAEIDADAQEDVLIGGYACVLRLHRLLQVDGAFHGVDDAGELDKDAVAHDLEDAPALLRDQWHQDIVTARPQQRHRAGLILLHEPAVADHVGGKNRGEAALDAFFGHSGRLLSRRAVCRSVGAPRSGVYRPHLRSAGTAAARIVPRAA